MCYSGNTYHESELEGLPQADYVAKPVLKTTTTKINSNSYQWIPSSRFLRAGGKKAFTKPCPPYNDFENNKKNWN